MMGPSCAVPRYTVPSARSRFVKPHVELAPRQVQIGFDLSPKAEKLGDTEEFDALTNSLDSLIRIDGIAEEHSNSHNLPLIKPASGHAATSRKRSTTSTSPRSALQQLLLAPLTQSDPASSSFPVPNPSLSTQEPQPACNSSVATTQSSTGRPGLVLHSTKPFTAVVHEPAVAVANNNWINSIAGQSRCTSSFNQEMKGSSNISAAVVSTIKPNAGSGAGCNAMVEAPISKNQLPWTHNSEQKSKESSCMKELHDPPACREKSAKSRLMMKEIMSGVERSYPHCYEKSGEVEIIGSRKESSNEKGKKSSLFVFAMSSPAAEYTTHDCLRYESNLYGSSSSTDMDFLNSCHLCKRLLNQDQDVFMYSGDKAFCSMECRYQQIVMDERSERHAPPVIRSGASPVFQGYATTTSATATATATTHRPIMINRPNLMNPAAAA